MKAFILLTVLVALVWLGVWNSPKAMVEPAAAAPHVIADVIGRGGAVCAAIHPDGHQCESDGTGDFVAEVKISDFKTQEQIETDYSQIYLPGAEMQDVSTYREATPISDKSPENYEFAYSGITHD